MPVLAPAKVILSGTCCQFLGKFSETAGAMNEDNAFLQAILADPGDEATRLVYADWAGTLRDHRPARPRRPV